MSRVIPARFFLIPRIRSGTGSEAPLVPRARDEWDVGAPRRLSPRFSCTPFTLFVANVLLIQQITSREYPHRIDIMVKVRPSCMDSPPACPDVMATLTDDGSTPSRALYSKVPTQQQSRLTTPRPSMAASVVVSPDSPSVVQVPLLSSALKSSPSPA